MAHKPTPETRQTVRDLKSFGHTHEEISKYLKIDHDTLSKHYPYELETALTHANSEAARILYKKAVKDEDVTCLIFWLKTRARWRTEDARIQDSDEKTLKEIKEIRASLDAKNRKDY